jgi:hypothetical protein
MTILDRLYEAYARYQFHNMKSPSYVLLGQNARRALRVSHGVDISRERNTVFGCPILYQDDLDDDTIKFLS